MTGARTDVTVLPVDDACAAAAKAFPVVRAASDAVRATWLQAIADTLDASTDELAALATEETRLPTARLIGEVARTTGQLRLFASVIREGAYLEAVIDHADPASTPPRPDLRRLLIPVGPVAVYAASNFPFAFSVAGGDTASALAVGCPVVVKAHPGHPETSRRTASLVEAALASAGAPVGTFALVEGFDAGSELVQDPRIRAAAFTGSVRGGRALADLAAARPDPIPFYGELGSVNPVVVTAAADAARGPDLADGLAGSFTLGSGQFCTKPGLVFVPTGSTVKDVLPRAVPAQVGPMLTESIATGFEEGAARLASHPATTLVTSQGVDGASVFAVPLADFVRDTEVLGSEVFGPVTLLVEYDDETSLVDALGRLEGSLTATVHAEASDDVAPMVDVLCERSGRVLFDGWPTGVAVSWAQQHGGPWPATTSVFTSVGATATRRFQRPLAYQDAPESVLPAALLDSNPLGIPRRVDGVLHLGETTDRA